MKHDAGEKVSTKKTLMNRISVSFYYIDFLLALALGRERDVTEYSIPTWYHHNFLYYIKMKIVGGTKT